MSRYTPIMGLPGLFVCGFENETIFCSCKGFIDYTLFFFTAPVPGKGGLCRHLLTIEVGYLFTDMNHVRTNAQEIWMEYREMIIAGDGERIHVPWPMHPETDWGPPVGEEEW